MTVGTRSATRPSPTKEPREAGQLVDYFQAGEGIYAKSSTAATFTASRACGFTVAWRLNNGAEATLKTRAKNMSAGKNDLFVVPNPDRSGPGGSSGRATFGFLDSQVPATVGYRNPKVSSNWSARRSKCPLRIATAKTASGKQLAVAIQAATQTLIATARTAPS